MFSAKNIEFNIGERELLKNVSIIVGEKEHIGLFGRNGSGKSTLLKILDGTLKADAGEIKASSGLTIMAVKQEMPDGEMTPMSYMLSQDKVRHNLFAELETCSDPIRMSEIYDHLLKIDAYSAESRAATILKGLGFSPDDQEKQLKTFSGGFRMRVALGSILFQEPDLLLLDEPTNHLDLEAAYWLENFLKKYPKSFILISHDRDFLNNTVTSILHLKNAQITKYAGNFDTFIDTYTLKQKNIAACNKKAEENRQHMLNFINRFHAKATKAKQVQSRIKLLEKIKFIPVDKDDATISFNFPESEKLSPPILTFDKVTLGYGDKIVLRNISGAISPDDRLAIVGANGNGKTTFARFLVGELAQKKGTKQTNPKLRIGFYRQDQFENLEINLSLLEYIGNLMKSATETQIRAHLGRFGLANSANQKIKVLSGGERARLLFAMITTSSPNLLVLDEPTNHLDLEMRESLISTLTTYQGAVVLITHDRNFLTRVANTIMVVENNTITPYTGDLLTYASTHISPT